MHLLSLSLSSTDLSLQRGISIDCTTLDINGFVGSDPSITYPLLSNRV